MITPLGITINANGFQMPDIPEWDKSGDQIPIPNKVRVTIDIMDFCWTMAKDRLKSGLIHGKQYSLAQFSQTERDEISRLNSNVTVSIEPTIWWVEKTKTSANGEYMGGLTVYEQRTLKLAVWYRGTTSASISNWVGYADWEMENFLLMSIGRTDLVFKISSKSPASVRADFKSLALLIFIYPLGSLCVRP